MARPKFDQKMQVRTTPRAKLALDRVVAGLRADPTVRWCGGRITQEAAVNAAWLWLEAAGPEVARDVVVGQLPRLEALLRGEPDPGADGGEVLRPDRVVTDEIEVTRRSVGEPPGRRRGKRA